MKLHHVGYLVKKIDKSISAFKALGFETVSLCGKPEQDYVYDEYRQCDICFMRQTADGTDPDMYVELISPKSPESPIWGLMSTYKNTPYHLCFYSDDLSADIQTLGKSGWVVFQPETPAPAIDGRSVVFLVNRSAGIIELVAY